MCTACTDLPNDTNVDMFQPVYLSGRGHTVRLAAIITCMSLQCRGAPCMGSGRTCIQCHLRTHLHNVMVIHIDNGMFSGNNVSKNIPKSTEHYETRRI